MAAALAAAVLVTSAEAEAEQAPAARAQVHVDAGQEAFDEGHWEVALREFRAARELVDDPMLTYNIALCLERLGQLPDAIEQYHRYLRLAPEAENAEGTRERIEELHRRRVEERDAETEIQASAADEDERTRYRALDLEETRHELDLVVGTAVALFGVRSNPGSAGLSVEFDYYYRITSTWHVGIAGLFDRFYRGDDLSAGSDSQSHYGGAISGRWSRRYLEARLEIRATAAVGYEFVQRFAGADRHWILARIGGTAGWAFWRGLGVQLRLALRLGFIAGGDPSVDSPFGSSLDITAGLFWAF